MAAALELILVVLTTYRYTEKKILGLFLVKYYFLGISSSTILTTYHFTEKNNFCFQFFLGEKKTKRFSFIFLPFSICMRQGLSIDVSHAHVLRTLRKNSLEVEVTGRSGGQCVTMV